jgi:hypothetical protein
LLRLAYLLVKYIIVILNKARRIISIII